MASLSACGPALMDLTLKATLLVMLAFVIVGVMRRSSAASRHLVWVAALSVILLVPVARTLLPALPLHVLPPSSMPTISNATSGAEGDRSEPAASGADAPVLGVPDTGAFEVVRAWTILFVTIWMAGVATLLFRGIAGTIGVRRLARRARHVDDPRLMLRARRLADELGVRRSVAVLISPDHWMPVTWGVVHPTLLLPAVALSWSDERLDAVLLHELAHVRRFDALSHGIGRVAIAAMWFNPLVRVAARRASLESEKACDDDVLAHGARPSGYANHLLALLQTLADPKLVPPGALTMARPSQFERRLLAILAAGVNRGHRSRLSVALAVLLVAMTLPVAAPRPVEVHAAFDAASVTRDTSDNLSFVQPNARVSTQTGGLCDSWGPISLSDTCWWATNMTLRELVTFSFARTGLVPPMPPIVNGPDWIDTDRFDVVARIAGNGFSNPLRPLLLTTRVRTLLEDHFKLRLHREIRTLPMYALVLTRTGRPGPQLRPASVDCIAQHDAMRAAFQNQLDQHFRFDLGLLGLLRRWTHPPARRLAPGDPCLLESGQGYLKDGATNMSQLAATLANRLNGTVRDQTGLGGMFAVDLAWASDHDPNGPSIFAALQQQLGLTLAATTGPVDVLVIDRASPPSPDANVPVDTRRN